MIHLSPLQADDLPALLAFELANRAYFEANINARPAAFYSELGVREAIASAVREACADKAYSYLIRDDAGQLIGRINLTRVRRAHYQSAELGYRIAEAETGKGYAKEAVRLMLFQAAEAHELIRLEATARPENIGSTRVLLHNGFSQYGRSSQSFEMSGTWYDLVHFERRLHRSNF